MNLTYKNAESTIKPAVIDIQKTTVYVRKDIVEVERSYEGTPYTVWVYKEAELSHEEFNKYATQITALNAIKGVDTSDNQLIIMEAIADLYDVIAGMME